MSALPYSFLSAVKEDSSLNDYHCFCVLRDSWGCNVSSGELVVKADNPAEASVYAKRRARQFFEQYSDNSATVDITKIAVTRVSLIQPSPGGHDYGYYYEKTKTCKTSDSRRVAGGFSESYRRASG